MFDFSILITALIAILIFYFTLLITLNKEIGDLSSTIKSSTESYLKIKNRKSKLKFLNIITTFLIILLLILYFLPNIAIMIKEVDITDFNPISFSDIGNFLLNFLPFKEGFFSDTNFKFSFITGLIFSFIFEVLLWIIYKDLVVPIGFIDHILEIITLISSAIVFLWINNYISLFLTYCIIHCFPFLSIVFNLLIYIIFALIITIVYAIITPTNQSENSSGSTKK